MSTPIAEAFTALERAIRKEERATARREIMDLLTATEALENAAQAEHDEQAMEEAVERAGRKAWGFDRSGNGAALDMLPRSKLSKAHRKSLDATDRALAYIKANPGCTGPDIRKALGLSKGQFIELRKKLRPKLKTKGTTRAMRYWVKGGGK